MKIVCKFLILFSTLTIFSMMDEKKILFIERHRNGAWGSQDEGKFVTADWNVYHFNLVEKLKKYLKPSIDKFMLLLKEISQTEKPSQTIDKKKVQDAYFFVNKIDKTSKMIKIITACDDGKRSLLIYYQGMLVPLATSGDSTVFIDSKEVEQIIEILDKNNFYQLGLKINDIRRVLYTSDLIICPSPFDLYS